MRVWLWIDSYQQDIVGKIIHGISRRCMPLCNNRHDEDMKGVAASCHLDTVCKLR